MRTTNKLKWEAEVADSGKGWVTVNPATGNGDTRVTIDIKNSDVWADPSTLESEVTFRCTNCNLLDDESKTKKIQVCRCACDCDELTVYKSESINSIPESGLSANSILGAFSLNSRCNKDVVTAELINEKTGAISQLKCDGGSIKLINAIPYNEEMSEVNYKVNAYFDRMHLPTPCSYFTFKQDALLCDCNSAVKNKITYSNYFNGTLEIPQSGLTVGTELFTYNLKQFCPDSLLTAKVMYGTSTTRDVTISGGVAKLAQKIGENVSTNKRDVTIKIYYGESENELEECETKTTKQIGCNCGVFFVPNSFDVSIPTFGYVEEGIAVKVGDTIGSYRKNADTTCSDENINAYLSRNNVTYPLSCSNGVVKLGGERNIMENIEHEDNKFQLVVNYAGSQCDSDTITQKGVACNCSDIEAEGRISNFDTIPKEGLPINSQIGSYSLQNTQCSDDNDCLKIEEVNNRVAIRLENGMVLTNSAIGNNEDIAEIEYEFKVYYKVNGKWRECKTITTRQKGLVCSCEMVTVEGDGWVSFPTSGTRGLVKFAQANTGLYKYKGTPDEELVGVCGSLSADCKCTTIVKHDGKNVTVVPIPLTEEEIAKGLEMPYRYEFYVDLEAINSTVIVSQRADLYFIPKDGGEAIECNTDAFGFFYDPNACNCQMNILSSNTISCSGYATSQNIASINYSHSGMTIIAELLQDGQEYDISAESITGATYVSDENKINLIAKGNLILMSVDSTQYLGEGERITSVSVTNGKLVINIRKNTGGVRTTSVELKTLVDDKKYTNSGTTYITDFETSATTSGSVKKLIIKGKVSTNGTTSQRQIGIIRTHYWCNKGKINEWYCGYIDAAILQDKGCTCDCEYVTKQQYSSNYWEINFSPNETYKSSTINPLTGNRDCAYYYLNDTDEDGYVDLGWCKVKLEKNNYYGWQLYAEITDGRHDNRDASVTVYYAYISGYDETTGEPIYVDCGHADATITDEVCNCDAINRYSFENKTVTIQAGETTGSTYWYDLSKVENCIQLYIDDNGTPTGTSSSEKYEHKVNGETIFTAYISSSYNVYVYLERDIDQEYTFVVKPRYKNESDEWVDCDLQVTVTVKQNKCTCDTFKGKVTMYTDFSYTQNDTRVRTIDVAYVDSRCGKGTLFVEYGNNRYCAADINDMPEELNYIRGIASVCSSGYLGLEVEPLDSEHTSRQTTIGVCLCNDELGGCKCIEETCVKTATVYESWSYDCSSVSCNDYRFNLVKESSGEFEIPCNTPFSGLVATYNTPPECFTVEATTTNEYITVNQRDMGNGYVGIYINARSSDQVVSPTIDVNVYKSGVACQSDYKRIDIKICKQN